MKAQAPTLNEARNTRRSRTILAMMAGLVVLAAGIAGAILAFSQRPPTAEIAARGATSRSLITNCRVCRDEALAARQALAPPSGQVSQPITIGTSAQPLIAVCRVCRDEALGARQDVIAASERATPHAMPINTHALIAACRVCRDETLGGETLGVSAADEFSTQQPFIEPFRRSGPR